MSAATASGTTTGTARPRLHADEVDIDPDAVRRALDAQHPRFRDLPLTPLAGGGTINRVFRLGDELVVRVPLIEWGARDAEREARILPRLHGMLPVATPELVALGAPAPGIPWSWTVLDWLPGRSLSAAMRAAEESGATRDAVGADAADAGLGRLLGETLATLAAIEVDGDTPLETGGGDPVAERATLIDGLRAGAALIDVPAAVDRLERDLAHPLTPVVGVAGVAGVTGVSGTPGRARAWTHGDPLPGNLVVDGAGALTAIIDWSSAGAGDTTHDLVAAWWTVGPLGRRALREVLDPSEADWHLARLRAWRKAAAAVGYYAGSSPIFAADARRAIERLVADAD
ncbi:phosphotransferase [Schumannella sp. 10F1B-5-1]|uniref:phosphotransferase n=1 Tax=Schumannella sp. 10F1B-5-1 TaxID=2590780 RepID=UPI0015E83C8F|nr:phosphotransferase [Schumannella sp. 10F1B-5-1]